MSDSFFSRQITSDDDFGAFLLARSPCSLGLRGTLEKYEEHDKDMSLLVAGLERNLHTGPLPFAVTVHTES